MAGVPLGTAPGQWLGLRFAAAALAVTGGRAHRQGSRRAGFNVGQPPGPVAVLTAAAA